MRYIDHLLSYTVGSSEVTFIQISLPVLSANLQNTNCSESKYSGSKSDGVVALCSVLPAKLITTPAYSECKHLRNNLTVFLRVGMIMNLTVRIWNTSMDSEIQQSASKEMSTKIPLLSVGPLPSYIEETYFYCFWGYTGCKVVPSFRPNID